MDFEDGMSLARLLAAREERGRPFDEKEMLRVVGPLLNGLKQVHSAGTLHRDIKPGNIIIRRTVSEEGQRPVLIDFGAAKQALGEHSRSFAPYTAGYAAIEQVGEGRLGPWTDIYAMGAVMWRIVAGGDATTEQPIPVKVESRAGRIIQGRPDPLRSARGIGAGRFSRQTLDAVDKCLRLSESDRFQDCGQLLAALQAAGATVPGSSERNPQTRHSRSSALRRASPPAKATEVKRPQPIPSQPAVPDSAKHHDRTRVPSPPAIVWLAPTVQHHHSPHCVGRRPAPGLDRFWRGQASSRRAQQVVRALYSRVCSNRADWRRAVGSLDEHLRDGGGDVEDRGRRGCDDEAANSGQGGEPGRTDHTGTARPIAFRARDWSGQVLQANPRCGGQVFAPVGVRSVSRLRTVTGGASSGGRDSSGLKRTEPSNEAPSFVGFASGLAPCQSNRGEAPATNSIATGSSGQCQASRSNSCSKPSCDRLAGSHSSSCPGTRILAVLLLSTHAHCSLRSYRLPCMAPMATG